MSTTTNTMPGRELTDEELAGFHGGGECRVTITRNNNGQVNGVKTEGQCDNVKVIVQA